MQERTIYKVDISTPYWKHKAFGVQCPDWATKVEVTCSYRTIQGNLLYPGKYHLPVEEVKKRAVETKIAKGNTLYIVPVKLFGHTIEKTEHYDITRSDWDEVEELRLKGKEIASKGQESLL